ncbi:AraC-like DNA-binding protein [Virgibacillus natechei]|uniref:AraC-like DNA-binding protein n=1 Tax=Virgibacillus natechei TaxID=1216297 RepID=A0ABS4IJM9_9BACI|nr:helix-turn-helix transcriptional regulator [Virgibacillus natechei]MBP1971115.1 AraC-like DNA-binding protein [Virgibacillus natechei]UZD12199.1 helix-turn-helix transcriptional regulator [Virgibacillus natechei]
MKEVIIQLNEETYEQINEITELENLINRHRDKNRRDDYEIEDFIVGSIVDKIEQIKHFDAVHPLVENHNQPVIKNRFKEIAKQKNIYIKDVADQLNMKPPNVSKIFNNVSQPRLELFIKIWLVLGSPPLHQCIYLEEE